MLIIKDLKKINNPWTAPPPGTFRARPGVIVMKFGEQLRSSVIREYQWYYIDYNGLKSELKNATGPAPGDGVGPSQWSEDDETRFVGRLEAELEKVHTKQQVKAMEISRRIAVSEREVKDVVSRLQERGLGEEGPSEEEFILLEEDLSDIIADVHDLAKFVQLNYTGFYKIIKKHDVRRRLPIRDIILATILIIIFPEYRSKLAGIYDPRSTPDSRPSPFTRKTTTPPSSSFPSSTISFEPEATLSRAIPLPAAPRPASFGRPPNTGFTRTMSQS